MDMNELKLAHYRERVADFEEKIAEQRAQIHLMSQELERLRSENASLANRDSDPGPSGPDDGGVREHS